MENNGEVNIQLIESPNNNTNETSAEQRKIEADKTKKRAIGWAIASGALALATTAAVIVATPYLAGIIPSLASWSWATVSGVIWGWELLGAPVGIPIAGCLLAPFVFAGAAIPGSSDAVFFAFCAGCVLAAPAAVLGIGLGIASLSCFLVPALPFIAGLGALATVGFCAYKSISNSAKAKKILKGEPEEPEPVKLEKSNVEQQNHLDEKAKQNDQKKDGDITDNKTNLPAGNNLTANKIPMNNQVPPIDPEYKTNLYSNDIP